MPKATDLFDDNECIEIRHLINLFKGKVTRVVDKGKVTYENNSYEQRKLLHSPFFYAKIAHRKGGS